MAPLAIAAALAQFVPGILGALGGTKAQEVANTVVGVAEAITGTTGDKVVDALKADPSKLLQFQSEVMQHQSQWAQAELAAQRDVIVAEAKSESWLTRNWRPLVVIDFTLLVTAYWMGWTTVNLTESVVLSLLEIVQYALSGYVVGRSVEKAAPYLATMFNRKG